MTQAITPPVSFDELNTLKGSNTQTTIQAQLDSKDTNSLTQNYILVGDASGLAASVPMSGGATIVSSGLVTLGTNTSYATTATAAGTTTLVAVSAALQFFTGVTTQTITLPVVTTLALGWKIRIVNTSTGVLTVNSSGANLVATINPGTAVEINCILITGTSAASWSTLLMPNAVLAPQQAVRTTNVSVTADYPIFQDITGLVKSFTTTKPNQFVEIKLVASALLGVATTFVDVAYKIDAGSDVTVKPPISVTSNYCDLGFATDIQVSTPGTYSLQIRIAKAGTTFNVLGVTDAPEAQATLTVTPL